jgi:hypothetical protein
MVVQEPIAKGETILDIREDAKISSPLFHLVNHSCAPTATVDPRGLLAARYDLEPGTEVTLDYLMDCDFTYGFACECELCKGATWVEKEFDARMPRIAPGLIIGGQVGGVVITPAGKSKRVPQEVICLNS